VRGTGGEFEAVHGGDVCVMYESRESSMYVLLGCRYCSRGAQDPTLSSTSSMSSCATGLERDAERRVGSDSAVDAAWASRQKVVHQNRAVAQSKRRAPVNQKMSAVRRPLFFPCDRHDREKPPPSHLPQVLEILHNSPSRTSSD
jgi:hypothetical protein